MSVSTVRKTIDASADRVWAALSDVGQIYRFHPHVARSPILGGQRTGIGAQRRCEFHDGNHVVEEVVAWDEGKSMQVEIVSGSMPLKCADAFITLERVDDNQTEVVFEMKYVPKGGPLGYLMDLMMMRRMFQKILASVLDGLQTYLQTGETIGRDGRPLAGAAA